MTIWIHILVLFALLGSGLIAGVLFVFSISIMAAFARIPAAEGIRAMQTINRTILNPLFMVTFIGPAVLSAALSLLVLLGKAGENGAWILAASLFYILGTFLVTVLGNVPMNEKLDTIDPGSGDAYWQSYLRRWTRLNHFRTATALVACALFAIALI
jgi:uncharacterized membrane protein